MEYRYPWYSIAIVPGTNLLVPWYTCTYVRTYVRTYESVGVCCPAFAPSLNWLPCILPKHAWFSVHMCPFRYYRVHWHGIDSRYHGTRAPMVSRQWCEDGSESVGVCCPAFAPSLNWLPCILPPKTHVVLSAHVCPFPIRKL